MAYQIEWTHNAKDDLKNIFVFLETTWSLQVADNFLNILDEKIELIRNYPLVGKSVEKNGLLRKVLITKHNFLYYLIDKDKVILLDFFDTRQNPAKNYFE